LSPASSLKGIIFPKLFLGCPVVHDREKIYFIAWLSRASGFGADLTHPLPGAVVAAREDRIF